MIRLKCNNRIAGGPDGRCRSQPSRICPILRRTSPFYTEEHEAFRSTVRRFVEREIMPHVDQWDEAEEFPRELYRKASAAGLLQLGFPEEYGGVPTDPFFGIIKAEEMARHGSGGRERQPQQPHDRLRRPSPRSGRNG